MPVLPAKKTFSELPRYIPGKHQILGVKKPIVLSANENPRGASPKALEAMEEAAKNLHRYPPDTENLKSALRDQYDLNNIDGEIFIGAGSDEIISLLNKGFAKEGSKVLYSQYGFLMYPLSAMAVEAIPQKIPEKNYQTNLEAFLEATDQETSIIFLANPNNPTGSYLNKTKIQNFVKRLPDHVLLVLDNAYCEYVEEADYCPHHELIETGQVVTTHTFSKIYGLAGLRIGWAFLPPKIADILERLRSPFNVNHAAISAAEASLQDLDYRVETIAINQQEKQKISQALAEIRIDFLPSVANFLLLQFDNPQTAENVETKLMEHGILVRNMRAYDLASSLRVSIGIPKENDRLLSALRHIQNSGIS